MENPQTDNDNNDKKYYDNMYKIANNYYYKKYIDINKININDKTININNKTININDKTKVDIQIK